MADATALLRSFAAAPGGEDGPAPDAVDAPAVVPALRVVAYPASGSADALALGMLADLLHHQPVTFEIASPRLLASEVVSLVRDRGANVLCIADLPPSLPSKTRYVLRKLCAALPDGPILVGRWAQARPPSRRRSSTRAIS
jgi:hypothetical protein